MQAETTYFLTGKESCDTDGFFVPVYNDSRTFAVAQNRQRLSVLEYNSLARANYLSWMNSNYAGMLGNPFIGSKPCAAIGRFYRHLWRTPELIFAIPEIAGSRLAIREWAEMATAEVWCEVANGYTGDIKWWRSVRWDVEPRVWLAMVYMAKDIVVEHAKLVLEADKLYE